MDNATISILLGIASLVTTVFFGLLTLPRRFNKPKQGQVVPSRPKVSHTNKPKQKSSNPSASKKKGQHKNFQIRHHPTSQVRMRPKPVPKPKVTQVKKELSKEEKKEIAVVAGWSLLIAFTILVATLLTHLVFPALYYSSLGFSAFIVEGCIVFLVLTVLLTEFYVGNWQARGWYKQNSARFKREVKQLLIGMMFVIMLALIAPILVTDIAIPELLQINNDFTKTLIVSIYVLAVLLALIFTPHMGYRYGRKQEVNIVQVISASP